MRVSSSLPSCSSKKAYMMPLVDSTIISHYKRLEVVTIRWASRSSWRCQLVRLSFLALIVLEYPVSNDWPLQLMYEKLSIAWVGPGRPGRPAWLEAQLSA